MTEASLQDRLRDHAKAFDGLLSLIPAKQYYGEDISDQWKKKKQTKKEAAAARRGKLDPDSDRNKNAKEVMDERARNKRKQRQDEEEEEEGQDDEEDNSFVAMDGVEAEQPGQGLKKATEKPNKKQKVEVEPEQDDEESGVEVDDEVSEEAPATEGTKLSKKEKKRAEKRERKAEKKATKTQRDADEQHTPSAKPSKDQEDSVTPKSKKQKAKKEAKAAAKAAEEVDVQEDAAMTDVKESSGFAAHLDVAGLDAKDDSEAISEPHSPTFDAAEPASTTTSVSSTIPPSEKPKHIVMPKDTSALRERLAAKIEALRAARKADGPDGKPIRTRQELIEARRSKQVQRKEHKKELRRISKLEEERKREETLASNSPGLMSPAAVDEGNFSFGRVAFADGSQMSHDLSYVLAQSKRKGPSDAKTALLRVQNQKKRLEGMDAPTRNDIADKEAWLAARRRVEGDKIRDDEATLKKTIKRKEAGKKKSEKAWGDRLKGVSQAQKERVRKREDNLRKRRDDKLTGKGGKKKKGAAAGGGAKKKGGRPGFEGSFGVGGRKK
ncbi:60S ribosome biogenesis [Cordyceps militaris]|uniref:60S ribosome biogenesis n=1 Tax=Cordyceps militaris TaxID=73501 RepID=A0A2H4SNP4_CORMI|nr:60S ribosome biogenesis [Cordyceps militaris]